MAAVGKSEIRNPKSEIAFLSLHLVRGLFLTLFSGAQRTRPLQFLEGTVGSVVTGTAEAGLTRVFGPRQHSHTDLLEEVAELFGLLSPERVDDRLQPRRLEALVVVDQLLTIRARLEEDGAAILV